MIAESPAAIVHAVIVNYRTAALTVDCLRSLETEVAALPGLRVWVVDNASGDGSADVIAAAVAEHGWSSWATVLPILRNGGYSAGNNAGIRPALAAGARYVWLLNPDTVVRPGAVRALVDFLERDPAAGIVGSRLEDPDTTPQRSAFRFPTCLSELDDGLRLRLASRLLRRWQIAPPVSDRPCPTDWVAGASMMIRREVFDAVGLLDEAYFLYFEEVDFCLHARRAGWPCWYEPGSRVVHLVGRSTGLNSRDLRPPRRPAYWFESRKRYFLKNHGRGYAALADLLWSAGHLAWRLRRVLQARPDTDPPHLLSDLLRHSVLAEGLRR